LREGSGIDHRRDWGDLAMPLDAFTDTELATIDSFARPLPETDREPFARAVGHLLEGCEVGAGNLHRACRDIQREFLRTIAQPGSGKYR
jgi:hypothetical protein